MHCAPRCWMDTAVRSTRAAPPTAPPARGDLRVRVPEADQLEDFDLPGREVVRWALRRQRLGGDAGPQLRIEVRPSLGSVADGMDELVVGGLLEHVRARSGTKGLPGE